MSQLNAAEQALFGRLETEALSLSTLPVTERATLVVFARPNGSYTATQKEYLGKCWLRVPDRSQLEVFNANGQVKAVPRSGTDGNLYISSKLLTNIRLNEPYQRLELYLSSLIIIVVNDPATFFVQPVESD